jgi:hypothetical protein
MPKVDIVQKHNTSARRIYIQGTNGKVNILNEVSLFIIKA